MKNIAKHFLDKLGYRFINVGRKGYDIKIFDTKYPHSLIIPRGTYSPWLNDQNFLEIYSDVFAARKVDIYRMYELWQLVQEVRFLEGALLEVGVYKGATGAIITKKLIYVELEIKFI